jgi:hypothetical protein
MSISNDDLFKLVNILPEGAKQSAYDFLRFLAVGPRPDWDEIMKMAPDDVPLSKEEEKQLQGSAEFVSWEDAMNELNLPADIKP